MFLMISLKVVVVEVVVVVLVVKVQNCVLIHFAVKAKISHWLFFIKVMVGCPFRKVIIKTDTQFALVNSNPVDIIQ